MAYHSLQRKLRLWLCQGVSPRRLALTLALGCVIGCLPIVGLTTVLCATLALVLRLNLPVIQAANYAVMPAQLLLIFPFIRLGGWLLSSTPQKAASAVSLLHSTPLQFFTRMGALAGQALLAWFVVAIPVAALITFALTPMLRRIPAIRDSQSIAAD
jgi:uncharacterized protein (DUF2062 family)